MTLAKSSAASMSSLNSSSYAASGSSTTTLTTTAVQQPKVTTYVLNAAGSTPVQSNDVTSNHSKDALCRRMGALFLRHRVEQLEDDVDRLASGQKKGCCPFQRSQQQRKAKALEKGNDVAPQRGSTMPHETEQAETDKVSSLRKNFSRRVCGSRCQSPAGIESGQDTQRADPKPRSHSPAAQPSPSRPTSTAKRVIVADASLLIYSLRTVHQWLKAGDCRVVVPSEALSTLDVLKKGDEILNFAARRATRFLDEQFSNDFQPDLHSGFGHNGASTRSPTKLVAGLFPQIESHTVQSADKRQLREAGIDVDVLAEAPPHIQKTLACIFHFIAQLSLHDEQEKRIDEEATSATPLPSCTLAIALPPPHLDLDEASCSDGQSKNGDLRYASRADGNVLLEWANKCGLSFGDHKYLFVAPTAASWLTAKLDAQNPCARRCTS